MNIVRDGSSVTIEMSEIDFINIPINVESSDQAGFVVAGSAVSSNGSNGTITFKMNSTIYPYIADIAAGGRLFKSTGFLDDEARRISDEFLNNNLQLTDADSAFSITKEEEQDALADVTVEYEVVFNGDFFADENYVLRADIGTKKINFLLIPTSLFTEAASGSETYVDSKQFSFPADENDDLVSPEILSEEINAFEVAIIEKTIDLSTRTRDAYSVLINLIGYCHRYGYSFGDIKKLYEDTLIPMAKFDFIDKIDNSHDRIPNVMYGIPSSSNAFVIADMTDASFYELGLSIFVEGTVSVKFIVGNLKWPSNISFIESVGTFDIITDSNDNGWEEFGPIRGAYIDSSSDFQTECMHSWEGRKSLSIKKIGKIAAGISDSTLP